MDYTIIIYVVMGITPSLIWLFYYLSKDLHPEPKRMIIKVFLWGCFITVPVFLVQMGFSKIFDSYIGSLGFPKMECSASSPCINPYLEQLTSLPFTQLGLLAVSLVSVYWFFIIAFSEELFKNLVVKIKVVDSLHLDEPVDVMLYAIVAALGFTAVENVLYCFVPMGNASLNQILDVTFRIAFVRFVGATFLHTLASGLIGYFMAISFCEVKWKRLRFLCGLLLATALHGAYNFSIMTLKGEIKYIIPATVIIILAFMVFTALEKLKSMKSICKIK